MRLEVIPVEGIAEVHSGDDVAAQIVPRASLQEGDVLVIAHKIVSKAEGRVVAGTDRRAAAAAESVRVLRRSGEMVISETRHGFVCANAGVDASNVEGADVVLLPVDPDLSARRIRSRIAHLSGVDVAIVISDTFGRAWRLGQTNVAIGLAGIDPFIDYRGAGDDFCAELTATRICIADELAAAAEIVIGKTERVPAAIVRGAPIRAAMGAATEIVRPVGEDMFR